MWVQHSDDHTVQGSDEWRIVPSSLRPTTSHWWRRTTAMRSRTPTSRTCSPSLGVGRLVVTGAQTDACVRSTLHGAFVRGYDATLVSDAHTTEDLTEWGAPPPDQVIAHTNLYWSFQTAPGRTAATVVDGRRRLRRPVVTAAG